MKQTYSALLRFTTVDGFSSTTVRYIAKHTMGAVIDIVRWWDNRHKQFPDHFSLLLYVKVSRLALKEIDESGNCNSNLGPSFFEWKKDFPVTLDQAVQTFARKCKKEWS